MDTKALRRQLLESVALLEFLGRDEVAHQLHLDVINAGHDARKLITLTNDAERLLGA